MDLPPPSLVPSGRGKSRGGKQGAPPPPSPANDKKRIGKPPKSVAVTVLCPEGQYDATAREARSKIDLASLGIEDLHIKRALTGALTYEVFGEGKEEKAGALACNLREKLAGR